MTNLGKLVRFLGSIPLHTRLFRGASSTLMQEIAQGSVLLPLLSVMDC